MKNINIIFLKAPLILKYFTNTCDKDKYKQLELFSNVLSNFLQIVGNFYSGQLINEEELEEILKFIIILSIASKNTNTPNMNIMNINNSNNFL